MSGPESQTPELAWHTFSVEQVLAAEGVSAQRGLSSAEAAARHFLGGIHYSGHLWIGNKKYP